MTVKEFNTKYKNYQINSLGKVVISDRPDNNLYLNIVMYNGKVVFDKSSTMLKDYCGISVEDSRYYKTFIINARVPVKSGGAEIPKNIKKLLVKPDITTITQNDIRSIWLSGFTPPEKVIKEVAKQEAMWLNYLIEISMIASFTSV